MPTGLQLLALAGMGKQSVFETSVVPSQPIYLISENLKADASPFMSEFRQGSRASEYLGQMGHVRCGGPLVEQVRYLLTSEPAHLLLQQTFGKAYGHQYRNLLRESWVSLRIAAADNQELSFSFTTPATPTTQTVAAVAFPLKRLLNPSGNLSVEIQADTAGDPSGTPISNGTSGTVAASAILLDGGWIWFLFATPPTTTPATAYHAVLKGTYSPSATDNIQVGVEDVPSGGNFEIKDAAWANDATKNATARVLSGSFIDSFIMANSIEGLFATIAVDKQVSVHEYVGMKVQDCTIRSSPADLVRATYALVGYDDDQTPTSTAAMLAGLKNDRDFPTHQNLTVLIGDLVDALVVGDAVKLDTFDAKFTRPLDQEFVSGKQQAEEPLENGPGRVTVSLSLPRYAVDAFRAWQKAGTLLQAKAQWTFGGKYLTALFPKLLIDGQIEIQTGGQAPYSQKVELIAFRNNMTNSLMLVEDEAELNYLA